MDDHGHCEICKRMIALGKERCGDEECEAKYAAGQKEKKRSVILMVAALAAIIIFTKLINMS